ncbi:Rtp1p [Sporobolomyces salmoneus]|uniref:Rtp1p n=1 Tax=Sporobolomyces salmoneus TaxID=183962 RepID=UPI0031731C0B
MSSDSAPMRSTPARRLTQLRSHLRSAPSSSPSQSSPLPLKRSPSPRTPPPTSSAFKYFLPFQSSWRDNDQYSHFNNVVYSHYFDSICNEFLLTQCKMSKEDPIGLIVHSETSFKGQLSFPEPVLAALSVLELSNRKVVWKVGLFKAEYCTSSEDEKEGKGNRGEFGRKVRIVRNGEEGKEEETTAAAWGTMTHVFVERGGGRNKVVERLPEGWREKLEAIQVGVGAQSLFGEYLRSGAEMFQSNGVEKSDESETKSFPLELSLSSSTHFHRMYSPSSSTCPPLSQILQAISILTGQQESRPKLGTSKPTLASILSSRLSQLHEQFPELPIETSTQEEEPDEVELQRKTGQTALRLLEFVQQSLLLSSRSTPSTSTNASSSSSTSKKIEAPVFSVTQLKHLQLLTGIVSRWGIIINLPSDQNVLPAQFTTIGTNNQKGKGKGKGKERIVELDEEEERQREGRLKENTESLVRVLQRDRGELKGIVMSQVLLPLIATLVYLYLGAEGEEEKGKWNHSLEFLFKSNSLPTLLSTLLQLLSHSPSSSPSRSLLTSHLSSLLLRPGGVRSLLIVVIGFGANEGAGETGNEKKSEMIWNLLSNTRSVGGGSAAGDGVGDGEKEQLGVVGQLFEILNQSTRATLHENFKSTSSSSSSYPAPTSIPPPSIISATSYLLSHFLFSPPSSFSIPSVRSHILQKFHAPFLPLTYSSQGNNSRVISSTRDLLSTSTALSLLISNTPPHLLESTLKLLIIPLLPSLFSLLMFLSKQSPSSSRGGLGTGKTREKAGSEENEVLKEEIESLLYVFGKSFTGTGVQESVGVVTRAIEIIEEGLEFGKVGGEGVDEDGVEWEVNRESGGGIELVRRNYGVPKEAEIKLPTLSDLHNLRTAEEGPAEGEELAGEVELKVEPIVIVEWLKQIGKRELSAGLFLRWLDELRVLKSSDVSGSGESNSEAGVELAKKSVTRLQLILKMVEELGNEILTLEDPKEVIAFIGSTLDVQDDDQDSPSPPNSAKEKKEKKGKGKEKEKEGLGLGDLRIVDLDHEEEDAPAKKSTGAGGGSGIEEIETEFEGLGAGGLNEEMVLTALTLLLAVLEANEDLSISNTPLLRSINSRLSSLLSSSSFSSELIPPLAREAQTVLSLREASLKFSQTGKDSKEKEKGGKSLLDGMEQSRQKYQESLKLLQDPLLPVRAQGLHLLKSLIKPSTTPSTSEEASGGGGVELLRTDPALLPAILSIFLNSLSEDDSFLYLNAVQGLSTLVDVFGRQVIQGLIAAYTGGGSSSSGRKGGEVREVGEGEKGQREVDKRLRVGEALVQVVQRAGEALGTLQDLLLPPLLITLRQSTLPVPLRASAITILATMVETDPKGTGPVLSDLGEAMRGLLEIETVSYRANARPVVEEEKEKKEKKGKSVLIEEVDNASSSSEEEDDEELRKAFSLPTPSSKPPSRPEELADPTITTSKHPSLRRAALLFLSLLMRTMIKQRYDSIEKVQKEEMKGLGDSLIKEGKLRMPSTTPSIHTRTGVTSEREETIERAQRERLKITLGFVAETDEDELVRFQAREILEEMQEAGF